MRKYNFDTKKTTQELIEWIRNYFDENGKDSVATIGISGGKDSSVVAKLCLEALGRDRVIGVLMPCGEQHDIGYSQELCEILGIKNVTINIQDTLKTLSSDLLDGISKLGYSMNSITTINTPARIRMSVLYGVAGSVGGRVSCNSNLSEDWVGYATKFGDGAGDFAPLMNLTVSEVKAVGRELGLPEKFIEKTPIDGLCGESDEDKLGFTYETLDSYIREGICENEKTREEIDRLYKYSRHKIEAIPSYKLNSL